MKFNNEEIAIADPPKTRMEKEFENMTDQDFEQMAQNDRAAREVMRNFFKLY